MHIVIMGCGRVGSQLANTLDSMGRDVTVIDQEAGAFRRLRHGFAGKTIEAVGFDKEAMVEADIENAAAFAAVSSGDNSNIIAARVAREIFNVPTVVARIYDPRRAEIYERLGIPTVATVAWTTGQILRRIDPAGAMEEWRDSTGTIMLAELDYADSWIGRPAASITGGTMARVAFLTRYGEALLIGQSTVLQEGDLLHVLCHPGDKDRLVELAANAPGSM
ncbi:MAG: potassium channel family protein [Candidatus Nanopelagicales bacterium]